jgi:hypothetical protein
LHHTVQTIRLGKLSKKNGLADKGDSKTKRHDEATWFNGDGIWRWLYGLMGASYGLAIVHRQQTRGKSVLRRWINELSKVPRPLQGDRAQWASKEKDAAAGFDFERISGKLCGGP